ncbi:hypothetical protein HN51_006106, partial [Arachis hypogaea]
LRFDSLLVFIIMNANKPSREESIFLAKAAQAAERYKEMVDFMKTPVLSITPAAELTEEERNLVSSAYKNMIGPLRTGWCIVSAIEKKENDGEDEKRAAIARAYKLDLESKMLGVCNDILGLLESNLLPSAAASDSRVFYLKMKGDYIRYLLKFAVGDDRKISADAAMEAYTAAQDIAVVDLAPSSPIRLGLILNFSVFCHEILNEPDKACDMAKQGIEEAIAEIKTLAEPPNKDTTLIIQLLRDNLSSWTTEVCMELIIKCRKSLSNNTYIYDL